MENVSKLAVGKTIIGITGLAGSGKDTFYSLLSKNIPFVRFSLADELKIMIRQQLFDKYGYDILSCSREQKNLMRDDLVSFAKQKRLATSGKYWTGLLEPKILSSESKFICVTDIRYNYYLEDEVFWIKNKLGGLLIDVSKYNPRTNEDLLPINEEESVQYPLTKMAADYFIKWPEVSDINMLDIFIKQAISDLNLYGGLK
jgi:hypothetical protein